MNSNHVRYASFVLLLVTGILGVGDLTKVFPFLPVQYASLTGIFILALKEWLMGQLTPATNARTPDNTPTKTSVIVLFACLMAATMGTTACNAPTSSNATVVKLENPNNIAQVVQGGVKLAGQRFLLKNPNYKTEVVAAADALVLVAAGNPSTLTAADIQAALANPNLGISASTQLEISGDLTTTLDLFEVTFALQFPGLKPDYAIYLDAVANGLYAAGGQTTVVSLPVITWPPVTAAIGSPAS